MSDLKLILQKYKEKEEGEKEFAKKKNFFYLGVVSFSFSLYLFHMILFSLHLIYITIQMIILVFSISFIFFTVITNWSFKEKIVYNSINYVAQKIMNPVFFIWVIKINIVLTKSKIIFIFIRLFFLIETIDASLSLYSSMNIHPAAEEYKNFLQMHSGSSANKESEDAYFTDYIDEPDDDDSGPSYDFGPGEDLGASKDDFSVKFIEVATIGIVFVGFAVAVINAVLAPVTAPIVTPLVCSVIPPLTSTATELLTTSPEVALKGLAAGLSMIPVLVDALVGNTTTVSEITTENLNYVEPVVYSLNELSEKIFLHISSGGANDWGFLNAFALTNIMLEEIAKMKDFSRYAIPKSAVTLTRHILENFDNNELLSNKEWNYFIKKKAAYIPLIEYFQEVKVIPGNLGKQDVKFIKRNLAVFIKAYCSIQEKYHNTFLKNIVVLEKKFPERNTKHLTAPRDIITAQKELAQKIAFHLKGTLLPNINLNYAIKTELSMAVELKTKKDSSKYINEITQSSVGLTRIVLERFSKEEFNPKLWNLFVGMTICLPVMEYFQIYGIIPGNLEELPIDVVFQTMARFIKAYAPVRDECIENYLKNLKNKEVINIYEKIN